MLFNAFVYFSDGKCQKHEFCDEDIGKAVDIIAAVEEEPQNWDLDQGKRIFCDFGKEPYFSVDVFENKGK